MEIIKACHKEYEVKQIISDGIFKCERKGKMFLIRKFIPYSPDGQALCFQIKKVTNVGIKTPKLIGVDKKNGYTISQFIDGEKLIDILSREDIKEEILQQLFLNAYMAKVNKMTLNYEPDKWILSGNVIYYTYPYYIKYDDKKDLATHYLPLYFNTKELAEFMKKKDVFYDKKRIKPTYDSNKEMVLATCKYYR